MNNAVKKAISKVLQVSEIIRLEEMRILFLNSYYTDLLE